MAPTPGLLSNHSGEYYRSLQVMTSITHLLGCSVLAWLISRLAPKFTLKWSQWKSLTWGKICLFLVLVDSWFFVFVSGFVLTGAGTSFDPSMCSLAIYACIVFDGSTKVLIYSFLVEKVYIVWSGGLRTPRLRSPAYKVCLVVQLGYVAVFVLFLVAKSSEIADNGVCILGLKHLASIPLTVYDFLQNVFFTFMFLWPLYRSKVMSSALRRVAMKTFIGAIACTTIVSANTLVFLGQGGHQLDWVCMTTCVLDVTLNALILYWVSSGTPSDSIDHFTLPTVNLTTGTSWAVDSTTYGGDGDTTRPGGETISFTTLQSLQTAPHLHDEIDTERKTVRTDLSLADTENSSGGKSEDNIVIGMHVLQQVSRTTNAAKLRVQRSYSFS